MMQKIRVVGFSTSDLSRGHSVMISGGFIAALVGVTVAGYGSLGKTSVAEFDAISSLARTTSLGIFESGQGGSAASQLSALAAQVRSVASGIEKAGSANLLPSGAKSQVTSFAASWADLGQAMSAIERPAADAEALRKQVSAVLPALIQVSRKIEPYRASAAGSLAFESISRLQGYATSGFGYEAAARVAYDLSNMVYQLRTSEASFGAEAKESRQLAEGILQSTAGAAAQAKSSQPTTPAIAMMVDRARAAQGQADALHESMRSADGLVAILTASGGALVICGLLATMGGVLLAVSEFGSRFRNALGQFDRGEGAMAKLASDARAIADGKLNTIASLADAGTHDLAKALNEIVRKVRGITEVATRHAATTLTRSREVYSGADEAEVQLGSQADGLTALAQDMRVISSSMEWMTHDATALSFAARYTKESLQTSSRAVQDSIERMDSIRDAMQDTSKKVKRLGERSQEVGAVLEDLSAMSEQINVLAMNAALEAERAGEAGRGFKIVAAEVKSISARVDAALLKAASAAANMDADARSAIESMERSTQRVASGAYVGEIAGASLMMSRSSVDAMVLMATLMTQDAATESENATAGAVAAESAIAAASAIIDWSRRVRDSSKKSETESHAAKRAMDGAYQ